MAVTDGAVAYIRIAGGPPVPATVRVEWLPDGQIRPLAYWMPDGSRYEVRRMYERIPNSLLKDRGAGLRFKVRAELAEAAEWGGEPLQNAWHEACLYLADGRYSGKTFIDGRYGHGGKEFIPVTLDVFPDGGYELVRFSVQGARYTVEKTVSVEPCGNFSAGGVGIRHNVSARAANADDGGGTASGAGMRRPASLYFEVNKWFVAKGG